MVTCYIESCSVSIVVGEIDEIGGHYMSLLPILIGVLGDVLILVPLAFIIGALIDVHNDFLCLCPCDLQ